MSAASEPNYIYRCSEAVTIKLPGTMPASGSSQQKTRVNIAKWQKSSWNQVGQVSGDIEADKIKVGDGLKEQGLFKLEFALETQAGQSSNSQVYVIVSEDWKKDFIGFCRNMKEEIESNPDPKLVFSSITVSHFDQAMEMAAEAPFLSDRTLKALGEAVENKKVFEAGQCPNLVTGLNKIRVKRFEGAGVAEFVVFVPEQYDRSRRWPLYLYPDPRRIYAAKNYSQHSGLIDVWWPFPYPMGFEWKDYEYLLGILRKKLNLDEDRFYLYGHCANGIPAMRLALTRPDQWAECGFFIGNSSLDLAGNGLNLHLILVKDRAQEDRNSRWFNFAVKCFQYNGCRYFLYSGSHEIGQTRGTAVPTATRERNPQRVSYTIDSLEDSKAYWVDILGREDENFTGTMDAQVEGQTIFVQTRNIEAYNLDLVQAPVDSNRAVEIIENGTSLGVVQGEAFTKRPEAHSNARYVKNKRIHGPIYDAFREPYVVVWGAGGNDRRFCETSEAAAKSLANGAPCFADTSLPESLLESHNLILVGTAETNSWLVRIARELPVEVVDGNVLVNGHRYRGTDVGFFVIYPNPLNVERYVVAFCGLSSNAMASILDVYSELKSAEASDVAIFEISEDKKIRWHIMEKFNTVWGWHEGWNRVLARTNKKHPEWQWRQWVARVIKEQLNAHVAVCKNPFRFSGSIEVGPITYRDLYNTFRNNWVVKIRTSGKDLRGMLMVLSNDILKEGVSAPAVEGVSLTKTQKEGGGNVLALGELGNDGKYTVALHYKLINGERIGMALKDYEILEEGWVVPLLKSYLCRIKNLDMDAQLDSLRLNMF